MSSPDPSSVPPWALVTEAPGQGPWGLPDFDAAGRLASDGPPDPLELAHHQGYQEGVAEGLAQARREMEPARDALVRAVGEIRREVGAARQRAEANIYALALTLARWLMLREVQADPATLEPLIKRAVAMLPAGSTIAIHANPADVEALSQGLDFVEPDGRSIAVHWVADASLDRGSFRLVSPERIIDGRVDVALRALYERLAGE